MSSEQYQHSSELANKNHQRRFQIEQTLTKKCYMYTKSYAAFAYTFIQATISVTLVDMLHSMQRSCNATFAGGIFDRFKGSRFGSLKFLDKTRKRFGFLFFWRKGEKVFDRNSSFFGYFQQRFLGALKNYCGFSAALSADFWLLFGI